MENRRNHNSTKVPRMSEIFPQAVVADKFVFLSGTPGLNPSNGKLSESFEEQTRQAFLNIKTILEETGSGLEKIVKTTAFMVSGSHFVLVNKVYSKSLHATVPAR